VRERVPASVIDMSYRTAFSSQGMNAAAQVGVLAMWERASASNPRQLPDFASFKFGNLSGVLDHLMYCGVRYTEAGPEFIIKFHGAGFTRTYGKKCFGRTLVEVLPEAIRLRTLVDYQSVALTKQPSFSSRPVPGENGTTVLYQRLLLPFTMWGKNTDRIVCVMNLKSTTEQPVIESGLMNANSQ